MNLVKWFRKNNTKVMAVVVIVLMIGFIGGSALSYLLNPSRGDKAALGYYGTHKIRLYDRETARLDLEILQQLGVPQLLQRQDLAGVLLTELLFRNARSSGDTIMAAQRAIQQYGYRVSSRQLADIFKESPYSAEILWILLREEARTAGVYFGIDEAKQTLSTLLSTQNGGPGYARGMGAIINRYKIPEDMVLGAFANLISVFEYADFICENEDLTLSQLKHLVSDEGEGLDATFVQFKASDFVDKQMTPAEPNMQAQFEKYKGTFAGEISENDPFGFGYKLPDRVQAEYIVVKLDDVLPIIKKPTQQDAETYYQQNRQARYTSQVRSDPNDPNSPMKTQIQSYSEVADAILRQLTRERVTAKAEQILTEAKSIADANLVAAGSDGNEPPVATLMAQAGKYDKIAQDLSRKYGIPVLSGRTGLITAADIQNDGQLNRLRLTTYGSSSMSVGQALFSVSELGDHAIIPLAGPATKMYRTIGPLRDLNTMASITGQIMAVARVVSVEKAAEPANLDVTYSTRTLNLGDTKEDANSVHSVRNLVADDLRLLAAWDKTKAKAQEFVELASKEGWEKAATKFNDLYGKEIKKNPTDPNVFRVDRTNGMRRITQAQMEVIAAQLANGPNAQSVLHRVETDRWLADRLYSLVPADANTAPNMPAVMEFKPGRSFYALETVTVQRLNEQQFQDMKNSMAYRNDHIETQSLAVVHFDPQNIVKRMDFRYAEGSGRRAAAPAAAPEDEF
jgi:hypothetical protein